VAQDRTGAIIGRSLAERYGWKIGDRVPLKSPFGPKSGGHGSSRSSAFRDQENRRYHRTLRYDYFDEARSAAPDKSAGIKCGWTIQARHPVAAAIDANLPTSSRDQGANRGAPCSKALPGNSAISQNSYRNP
jgi:putative ABC transport system permease protein